MSGSKSSRRAAALAVAVVLVGVLSVASAAAPGRASASCGEVLDFAATARVDGVSMFTGRAVREASDYRVEFAVERWFTGPHPAAAIHFASWAVGLVETPEAGVIPAVLARTVWGDAISLVRGQLVFVAAGYAQNEGNGEGYVPVVCGISAVPLASAEGQDYLARAIALYGQGLRGSELPDTATAAIMPGVAPDRGVPWLPMVAFFVGLGAALVALGRRGRAESATRG